MQSSEHQASGFQTQPHPLTAQTTGTVTETRPGIQIARNSDVEAVSWIAFLASSQQQALGRILYSTVFKRVLDVMAAATMLVMLTPLLILVALIIRLESPGQVIYRQARVGRNGVPFTIYKFRTMIPDRRKQPAPIPGEDRRKRHKSERDPRVTGVGRFLRRSSIDELPQLFNILKGDMSFVGPRPELPQIVENYQDWQLQRHLVTPGLSGWWQVVGRSDLPMHEHTDLDIYYVENQSFTLDAKIVLLTFRALLSRGGAF
jgi:lipopolysaccharide/colanic/teichoic acid biosynthesis glycosyltransferase